MATMQVIEDHNRVIAKVARSVLGAIGCKQKGRSRLWIDDRGWWVGVIEFQPSAWSRGSYLNVGAMWLWNAKTHWSFDEGSRVATPFIEFSSPDQFEAQALGLAEKALVEVVALRKKCATLEQVSNLLEAKPENEKNIWHHYHCAMAAYLLGKSTLAAQELDILLGSNDPAPWVEKLKAKASSLASSCGTAELARETLQAEVAEARALLKLPPLSPSESLWA
jgi:hypothetical protein